LKALFIHQNFPGQFRHLANHLAELPEWEVRSIGRDSAPGMRNISTWRYRPHRKAHAQTHPYARTFEEGVLHGQQVLRLLLKLSKRGYRPDIIIAHPGWGETLYVKQVYPDVPLIHYCEYYYHARGADADFDPEFPLTEHAAATIESRNALHLLNLEHCDMGVTPTQWQLSLQPKAYHHKLRVIHEGIDSGHLEPNREAHLAMPNGHVLRAGDAVVTYVARNLEPYRGFHQFMRALPDLLNRNPDCHVVIVGGDGVSYGRSPRDDSNWRTKLLRENPVDTSRVHFLGRVDYATYRTVLQISAAHVYLTYPFVLSWSLLEALACGCAVVASDTAPVREVLRNGKNAVLVDFLHPGAMSGAITNVLTNESLSNQLRTEALHSATQYSSASGNSAWLTIIKELSTERGRMLDSRADAGSAGFTGPHVARPMRVMVDGQQFATQRSLSGLDVMGDNNSRFA
jgi:glycosyltransferase involved in cell wall biosynthesis